MLLCMYGHTYSKSMDQPSKVANPARGQLNRENKYFPVRVRACEIGMIMFELTGSLSFIVVVVVVVFTLKAVPISTQYFLTSVLVQLTRTPSVVTG